ncbi:unnamed protein product [Cylindrotheca closterium]|uniref:Uncharacterized protein n=1 Tax=Cylindrotheca closterium TaxID=2856 RepID=A0AAD2GDI6_9STRA|nr:unnamed protein product [Cylindrotheca closterium]
MTSNDENSRRGYLARSIILTIGGGALGCSILTALSCDFIGVENVVVTENAFSDAPYLKTVGLFSFNSAANESCEHYRTRLLHSNFNEWFTIGQIASLAAPALGLIGWILVLSELLISQCRFNGSFVLQNVLFIAAFTFQCCTFLLLGQTQFCFYDKMFHCTWEIGSILSIIAASMFYLCSILLCCLSRPKHFPNDHDDRECEDDKV